MSTRYKLLAMVTSVLLLFNIIPCGSVSAEEPEIVAQDMELVAHYGQSVDAVCVQGGYAYIGEDQMLSVLDISDPSSPVCVGQTAAMAADVTDVVVSGDHAFVTAGDAGLYAIDVSDPSAPVVVDVYDPTDRLFDAFAYTVAVDGDYAYVAAAYNGLLILDVSDPTTLALAASSDLGGGECYDVTLSGDLAYVVGALSTDSLQILDVSDPTAPVVVGTNNAITWPTTIAVVGDRAVVANLDPTSGIWVGRDFGVHVVDVSDPTACVLVDSCTEFYAGAENVVMCGDYAYLADGYGGLAVFSISDAGVPAVVGSFKVNHSVMSDVDVSDGLIYATNSSCGLYILRYTGGSELSLSTESGEWPPQLDDELVADFSITNTTAEVLHIEQGGVRGTRGSHASCGFGFGATDIQPGETWQILDVHQDIPLEPGAYAFRVAYTSDGENWVELGDEISFSVLGLPVSLPLLRGQPNIPGDEKLGTAGSDAYGVYVEGDVAYVASGFDGLEVWDVSDPAAAVRLGTTGILHDPAEYNTYFDALRVCVVNGYAYVVADNWNDDRLAVIDVHDSANPRLVALWDGPTDVKDVQVVGDYAYLACGADGMIVVDVSNPLAPYQVSSIYGGYGLDFAGVAISDGTAYLAGGYVYLLADVTDPRNPEDIGGWLSAYDAVAVDAHDGACFFIDGNYLVIATSLAAGEPTIVGAVELPGKGTFVCDTGANDRARYVCCGSEGGALTVVDVSVLTNPLIVASRDMMSTPRDACWAGERLFVADDMDCLVILD